jgi:hypothetical protein
MQMKKFTSLAIASVMTLAAVSVASAQPYAASATPPQASAMPWFAYHHASTFEEGVLTGQARYLHSLGLYNQLTADALVRREEARTKALENEQLRVNTFFKLKTINAEYRAQYKPQPLTKAVLDQRNLADQPKRLNAREYNVDSGSLQWPAALQAEAFDAHRLALDNLFHRRTAGEFGPNSRFYLEVSQTTGQMKDMLLKYSKSPECWFGQQEYVGAKNFLDSLKHEARLAPNLEGIAAN